MTRRLQIALIGLILLSAAVLRLTDLDWDDYNHYHPDERYITWVATSIEWPQDWQTALNPRLSSFNPFFWPVDASSEGLKLEQGEPRRYAYGHLPLYLGVVATRLAELVGPVIAPVLPSNWLLSQDILNQAGRIEFRHLTAASRALTGLVDVASVGLLFFLGRWVYGPAAGLLAAAFLTVNVMHIQLAHFFAVDPYVTFFVLAALLFMILAVRQAQIERRWTLYVFLAAAMTGMAVGSKFSAILLLLPMAVTVWLGRARTLKKRGFVFVAAVVFAFVIFAITNPFAVVDLSCELISPSLQLGPLEVPALNWGSCYVQNVILQGTMVQGIRDVPYVRQYIGTTPYLYFIEMQLRWGMGPLLGLVAFVGFGWAVWRVSRTIYLRRGMVETKNRGQLAPTPSARSSNMVPVTSGELVLLTWTVPYFLTTGALDVKFMRYMQPLVPFLMLYGAAMLLSVPRPVWRRAAVLLVVVTTLMYALSFVNLYREPHPWIAASQWIYDNVEDGALIVGEAWDDTLPDNVEVNGTRRQSSDYSLSEVNWLSGTGSEDSVEKLKNNLAMLAEADYLVLSSNRNYGVIPRLPARYPLSGQYYKLLFDERLGFEVAYVGTRTPNLFGLHLKPEYFRWPAQKPPQEVMDYLNRLPGLNWGRSDESFTVYDQPMVIVFRNRQRLTAEEMIEMFAG